MANPNISLLGANYSGVAGVTLPKQGGGTATFPWVEGSETKTQNGTYDVTTLAQIIVAVSGGGGTGLVYESGTYTPGTDIAKPTISFSNTHSSRPFCVVMANTSGTILSSNSNFLWAIFSWYDAFGTTIKISNSTEYYARTVYGYMTSSSTTVSGQNIISISGSSISALDYNVTSSQFVPYSNSVNRLFRTTGTYKWIAVWKPTT